MSDEPQVSAPQTLPTIPTERSPSFRVIYSNFFRYRVLPAETSIIFSVTSDAPGTPSPNVVLIEEAQVIMSHSQIKNLVEHLTEIITAYEKEFGPIKTMAGPDKVLITQLVQALKSVGLR